MKKLIATLIVFAGIAIGVFAEETTAVEKAPVNFIDNSTKLNDNDDSLCWKSGYNFQGVTTEKRALLQKEGAPFFKIVLGEKALTVETLPDAANLPDVKAQNIQMTNALHREVIVDGPGKYVFRFQYKLSLADGPASCHAPYMIRALDAKRKSMADSARDGRLTPTPEFKDKELAFFVPEGGTRINFAFFIYGVGRLDIQNLTLTKEE